MIDQALATDSPWMQGITRERLEARALRPAQISAGEERRRISCRSLLRSGFALPPARPNFIPRRWRRKGLIRCPRLFRATNRDMRRWPAGFRWSCWPRKADNHMNSTFADLPGSSEDGSCAFRAAWRCIPPTPKARGNRRWRSVEVFNDRGKIPLRAKVNGAGSRRSGRLPFRMEQALLRWTRRQHADQRGADGSRRGSDILFHAGRGTPGPRGG